MLFEVLLGRPQKVKIHIQRNISKPTIPYGIAVQKPRNLTEMPRFISLWSPLLFEKIKKKCGVCGRVKRYMFIKSAISEKAISNGLQ